MKIAFSLATILLFAMSVALAGSVTLPATMDTGLYRNAAEDRDNFGHDHWIEIDDANEHGLVRWDLTSLPKGASVVKATIQLDGFVPDKHAHIVQAYLVTHDWVEGTGKNIGTPPWSGLPRDGASWDTFSGFADHPNDAWTVAGGDFDKNIQGSATTIDGQETYYDDRALCLDATPIVKAWLADGRPNYGVLLKCANGSFKFKTREEGPAPRLVIEYDAPR